MRLSAEGDEASRILKERREFIAVRVTNLFMEARPQLEQRWKSGRVKCIEDNRHHLDHLCEALSFGRPALFTEYATWAAALLDRLHISAEWLALDLELMRTTVAAELTGEGGALASQYLEAAIAQIKGGVSGPPTYIQGTGPLDVLAGDYLTALLRGERQAASGLIMDAVDAGTPVRDIYLLVFQRVLREIGRLWHANQVGVAQEHYATACIQLTMSRLYPRVFSAERNGRRLVAACVGGDLHEIGLRMVSDFFEMEGWDTVFLGANTPTSEALKQVEEHAPHVLAISATMPFHVKGVAILIAAMRAAGSPPRILVGGAPFNSSPGLWKDVGADGYARDAAEAIAVAQTWTT